VSKVWNELTIEVLTEDAGTNWTASSNDEAIKGVVMATAPTKDEAVSKFRKLLGDHIAFQRARGVQIPDVSELKIIELVPV
jgi:hypothetical protein